MAKSIAIRSPKHGGLLFYRPEEENEPEESDDERYRKGCIRFGIFDDEDENNEHTLQ